MSARRRWRIWGSFWSGGARSWQKRVFQVPVPIGKGKRRPDLFQARGVLPLPSTPW